MKYRIYSYNVNGIRSAISKGLMNWLMKEQPDMISFQELKAEPGQVDTAALEAMGYHHYWFPAEKKGYSGVALFSKIKPDFVEYGMGIADYDREGRLIRSDFGPFTILSVYFPSGTSGELRQAFKMKFLDDFMLYIEKLSLTRPNILVCGDVNIAHKEIDINHPKRHTKDSGFLPEERKWVDQFLETGFVDTFRVVNQLPEQYSWWTFRANARAKNIGWRIDYVFASKALEGNIRQADIHQAIVHSDHCPVSVDLEFID